MTPGRPQKRLLDIKAAFLAAFAACGHIADAADAVPMNRSNHYDWTDEDSPLYDAAYVAAFAKAKKQAGDMLRDSAIKWAIKGIFEPEIYKGKFSYAPRKRTLCKLADGTSAFEDELPKKHPKIPDRDKRTVVTNDGEMIGLYRRSEGLLAKLLAAHLPEEFGTRTAVDLSGHIEITDPDDVRREILRKLDGIAAAAATRSIDPEPE